MTKDLEEQIDKIADDAIGNMETFLSFLEALRADYIANPEEWENKTIGEYIDAMKSWIVDFSTCEQNDIEWDNVDYATMAQILYMGKIYE